MKTSEINIRDPYIMVHQDRYYMYGTRSETCWETADGFDCFVSENLEDWEGPFDISTGRRDFSQTGIIGRRNVIAIKRLFIWSLRLDVRVRKKEFIF